MNLRQSRRMPDRRAFWDMEIPRLGFRRVPDRRARRDMEIPGPGLRRRRSLSPETRGAPRAADKISSSVAWTSRDWPLPRASNCKKDGRSLEPAIVKSKRRYCNIRASHLTCLDPETYKPIYVSRLDLEYSCSEISKLIEFMSPSDWETSRVYCLHLLIVTAEAFSL